MKHNKKSKPKGNKKSSDPAGMVPKTATKNTPNYQCRNRIEELRQKNREKFHQQREAQRQIANGVQPTPEPEEAPQIQKLVEKISVKSSRNCIEELRQKNREKFHQQRKAQRQTANGVQPTPEPEEESQIQKLMEELSVESRTYLVQQRKRMSRDRYAQPGGQPLSRDCRQKGSAQSEVSQQNAASAGPRKYPRLLESGRRGPRKSDVDGKDNHNAQGGSSSV